MFADIPREGLLTLPHNALKAVDPAWGKEENWRIARLMTKDDLRGTDLDTFLEEL